MPVVFLTQEDKAELEKKIAEVAKLVGNGGGTGSTGGSESTGSNGIAPRIGYVTLLASEWVGSDNLYSQVVDVEGATENSQVDLTPNADQLAVFHEKDLAFTTENDGGVVTVYAIGQKPANDYTIQVTITEVEYE